MISIRGKVLKHSGRWGTNRRIVIRFGFRSTRYACYCGYVVQAIVNNLAPLLFIVFSESYGISYRGLGSLVLINFSVQLGVDALCIKLAGPVGYRPLLVAAQIFSAAGLVLLGALPLLVKPVYAALVIAVTIYGFGGGLLEVLVSPVVDSIPWEANRKPAAMSLLHSFYCWGQMAVILLSTFLLSLFGRENWYILPLLWAIVPLGNMFLFFKVPLPPALPEKETLKLRDLAGSPVFFICLIMMLCAGASEQAVAQWASLFAEKALGAPKLLGDIFGPAMFALLMGTGRVIYGIRGVRLPLFPSMLFCGLLCVLCYLGITLVPHPLVQLIACGLTGFSVSIMWPATFSLSSARFPLGGAALFALLALMGDLGCSLGPWVAGAVTAASEGVPGALPGAEASPLQTGILACIIFPLAFAITVLAVCRASQKR
ncbi:MAG: MFS transporter [Treponema sp.]|jgi:MFS family permease|nr:MFS transporter [Treponema sp.]